tara:strand:- start:109 stop:249 length:141 start_codon:yes stop_codon:yes gene_type:complete
MKSIAGATQQSIPVKAEIKPYLIDHINALGFFIEDVLFSKIYLLLI